MSFYFMEKQIIKGEMFIIPEKSDLWCGDEWVTKRTENLIGIKLSKGEPVVCLWISGNQCDNWNDQFWGFQKELGIPEPDENLEDTRKNRLLGYFPRYFPLDLIKNVREGDVIMLSCPEYGCEIHLKANQSQNKWALENPKKYYKCLFEDALSGAVR